ncbi:protein involved in gliding motility GldN [Lutibacter sp. Hel_I_33_5]|uniref:type IX secretion system ring protein PorN/GldN n=1 Tax=Lutibacter sp. Hel_I_33_5 TaxID=1566289 RepID=UPI00119DFD87|nr:gliding motility protein GldN [Lutibacter sp. Hel_I_33_5]TVZ56769.1 protein involved in gliding motility GldN [Lutibacter sp. Hel_I_33_5]
MYRNRLIIVLTALLATSYVHAQVNFLNATSVDQIGKKTQEQEAADNDGPLAYGYVDDRDILWSKVVWEFIDLNQKINLPYYFPIDTANISNNRRSLFDTLLKGVKTGKIKDVYGDSFFSTKVTQAELDEKLLDIRGEYKDTFQIQTKDIEGYMIKGMWYFDKRQGELKYRLIALAPMGKDVLTIGRDEIEEKDELYDLFWIFYPSARQILHEARVFNPKNSSHPISFDHLLNARRFSSVIIQEENIFGNRKISDYVRGNSLFQLLEADKIKEGIRNREMDMWNY